MGRWVDDICEAFRYLGGEASYEELDAVLQRHRHPVMSALGGGALFLEPSQLPQLTHCRRRQPV
jgi:hypothetical protein